MELLLWKEELVRDYDTARLRAQAGAAYLDRKAAAGWDQRIDLDRLDIKSPLSCVLAQVLRDGSLFFPTPREAVDCGFSCGVLTDFLVLLFRLPPWVRSFDLLTEAWREVILERRSQSQRPDPDPWGNTAEWSFDIPQEPVTRPVQIKPRVDDRSTAPMATA